MEFRDFLEQEKVWKAKRDDILAQWEKLRPFLPIHIEPIPAHHKGTRYDDDGIRITGSASFINSVLSRMKELLQHDRTPGMTLDVEYRRIASRAGSLYNTPRFVCYVYLVQDDKPSP